jgi:uncharacterized protein YqeY
VDLKSKIQEDMKMALKGRQEVALSALRMLLAEVKKREIDARASLSEPDVQKVVQTLIKQRRESVEAFEKGNRKDLADRERQEIEVLQGYLPKQLSAEEVGMLAEEVIRETGITRPEEIGKVMKIIMARAAGRADGKALNEAVRSRLAKAPG